MADEQQCQGIEVTHVRQNDTHFWTMEHCACREEVARLRTLLDDTDQITVVALRQQLADAEAAIRRLRLVHADTLAQLAATRAEMRDAQGQLATRDGEYQALVDTVLDIIEGSECGSCNDVRTAIGLETSDAACAARRTKHG